MWRCVFALVSLWLAPAAAEQEDDGQVIVLTDSNFDDQVQDGLEAPWFVKFYAPWCGHCKKLAPAWEELAVRLKGKVNVAKVDATEEERLATQYKLEGFPTLILITGAKVYTYEGSREPDDMAKWAVEEYASASAKDLPNKTSPGSSDSQVIVLTDKNFEDQVKDGVEAPWFVEFYAPWCGHCQRLAPAWEELATRLKGKVNVAKVDATVEQRVATEYKVDGYPTLILITGAKMYPHEGAREADDLAKWAVDEFTSVGGQPLPKNAPPPTKTLKDFLPEISLKPVGDVHEHVPWLMPAVFIAGFLWSLCLSWLLGSRKRTCKDLNETFEVKVSRDANKLAGFSMAPLTMTISKIDPGRGELSELQVGDTIIQVDGTHILDADDYSRHAHEKEKFVMTMGRATNANGKDKKDK